METDHQTECPTRSISLSIFLSHVIISLFLDLSFLSLSFYMSTSSSLSSCFSALSCFSFDLFLFSFFFFFHLSLSPFFSPSKTDIFLSVFACSHHRLPFIALFCSLYVGVLSYSSALFIAGFERLSLPNSSRTSTEKIPSDRHQKRSQRNATNPPLT